VLRLRFLALFAPFLLLLTAAGSIPIPTSEENAKARWADVQTELQRRNDLIGNLVETVKGFARQEREVLTQVTEARANATRVTVTGDQLTDPAAMARWRRRRGGSTCRSSGCRRPIPSSPPSAISSRCRSTCRHREPHRPRARALQCGGAGV
jgi:hypothetical protein